MKRQLSRPVTMVALVFAVAFATFATEAPGRVEAYIYTTVDAGSLHTCALSGSGGMKCWGRNVEGQLGDGTTTRRVYATDVQGLTSGVSAIGAGALHSCALLAGGTVKCWGGNAYGQVGDGTAGTGRLVPTTVCATGSGATCAPLAGVTAIAVGDSHNCAIVAGGVRCWGRNFSGQVGNGTTTVVNPNPVQVSGLSSGAVAVAAGEEHTCALMSAGSVKCWGGNRSGQVGDGTLVTNRLTPVDVVGLSGVTSIALGENHTCALLNSGGVKCWGSGWGGQLGDDSDAAKNTATAVCAPGAGTCGSLANVVRIAAGGAHTCALTNYPTAVYCWGWDGFGELSNGPGPADFFDMALRPTQVWGAVANSNLGASPYYALDVGAGSAHSCVVLDPSGWIYCWGWNIEGQLGDGLMTDRPTWAADTDQDGCTDEREAQTAAGTETSGGRRSPFSPWDFFDTPDTTNTTLSTPISSSTLIDEDHPLGITVASAVNFPSSGTLFIDQEKFTYSGVGSSSITLTGRAWDFTSAAQHNTNAVVMTNTRDKVIDANDAARVQARYGATGNPWGDQRMPPPPTGYSTAFDRSSANPNSWNANAPDGIINVADILAINSQVGHSCA